MAAERNTTVMQAAATERAPATGTASAPDLTASPLVTDTLKHLSRSAGCAVAQAPGRFDVMGGSTDYTGGLVLSLPFSQQVCVAVERRTDGFVVIIPAPGSDGQSAGPAKIPLAEFNRRLEADAEAEQLALLETHTSSTLMRCALGTLIEMLRARIVRDLGSGVSIVVGSNISARGDVGQWAAWAAATLLATARAFERTLELQPAVLLCQRVANRWLDLPVGPADAYAALAGQAHTLTQLRCQSCSQTEFTRLSDDVLIVGIDCGAPHPDADTKYRRVRTAAWMGGCLIDRIITHEGGAGDGWGGYLARISVGDYVGRFHRRLPTKLKGEEFLERFGETGDPLTRVEPDFVYKIRSRTEHPIYENARAHKFVECLQRAIRLDEAAALSQAGELMLSSHWSYGQRCGLGSVETDHLVNCLRKYGTGADLYGARVSGRGCGGVVVVLMRATDRAEEALQTAIAAYDKKTGKSARLLRGSSPGALVTGAQTI